MVSSAAHIPGHAAAHAARLKEVYAIRHPSDLFYPFAVEVFGALHPALDRFLQSLAALVWSGGRTYPSVLVVTAFLRQRVSVALQQAQAFMIQRRVEAVGFRVSRHVTLLDLPLTFTVDLYQALQFRVE
ncbi:unnamed protein product [Calypogeia fissa]